MQHAMPINEGLGTDEEFPLGKQSLLNLPAKMNLERHYGQIRRYQGSCRLLMIRYQRDRLLDRSSTA